MRSIATQIGELRSQFLGELKEVLHAKDLEPLRLRYFGKKGFLPELMVSLKEAAPEERPHLGKLINDLKEELFSHWENTHQRLSDQELEKSFLAEAVDSTLPSRRSSLGRKHPVTQTLDEILEILVGMGFSIRLGPDVDTDYYNFEGLNFPPDHPAREMQDTFYLSEHLLLRTHTSNVQVHAMEELTPPIRIVAPGRCFRNEDISTRSHVFFHQIEGFYIDENVHFGDLLSTMDEFLQKLFGTIETRFRPSYFPFVEPGMEVDVRCTRCKGSGCRLCKQTGWLEILGAGMIHPHVLKRSKIDPERYSGYAWGLGIERILLLRSKIPDIRLLTQNDLRFLSQFP